MREAFIAFVMGGGVAFSAPLTQAASINIDVVQRSQTPMSAAQTAGSLAQPDVARSLVFDMLPAVLDSAARHESASLMSIEARPHPAPEAAWVGPAFDDGRVWSGFRIPDSGAFIGEALGGGFHAFGDEQDDVTSRIHSPGSATTFALSPLSLNGFDFQFTAVPAPPAALLGAAGLAIVLGRRRARR